MSGFFNCVLSLREVAVALSVAQDRDERAGGRMVEPLTLVIHKEEQLVFEDRAADGGAEHVPAQSCTGQLSAWPVELVFPLVGVQHVVAEELPGIAMEAVGTRLDGSIDDAARVIAEFRRSIRSDQVEFFNGVGRRCEAQIGFLKSDCCPSRRG